MSIQQLHHEIETLIHHSGIKPSIKMKCSILRTLKMRHSNIDTPLTRNVIASTLEKHL